MARYPIPRPTEDAALRRLDRAPSPRHPVEELFAAMVHAYAVNDRRGLQLFGLAVVRGAAGPTPMRGA
jgi:hypothetical protein